MRLRLLVSVTLVASLFVTSANGRQIFDLEEFERRDDFPENAMSPEELKSSIGLDSRSLTPCQLAAEEAEMSGFVGNYVPQCDANGNYEPLQRHWGTGYSWCVDQNGVEIPGTMTRPGQPSPNCVQMVVRSGDFDTKSEEGIDVAMRSSSDDTRLSITVDSMLLELYVDGEHIPLSSLPNRTDWRKIDVVPIPRSSKVIAILVDGGASSGILASVTGDRGLTNAAWKCIRSRLTRVGPDWIESDYDDSEWPAASVIRPNPDSVHGLISGISQNAYWIWTADSSDHRVYCRGRIQKPRYFKSCKEILAKDPSAPSGEYTIETIYGKILNKVYCEMGLNGGGYTFVHPSDLPRLTNTELQAMFTDKSSFLMRLRKTDNTQPYGVLQQLPQYSSVPLKLGLNDYTSYAKPLNADSLGSPFLYVGFLDRTRAASRNVQGLQVNGKSVTFTNCDANPNNFIALYANFRESSPSNYAFSTQFGFSDALFASHVVNPSGRVIPEDYFLFLETHWGGCGTYTQTDGRSSARGVLGATIGFR